jgi:hypothetical protein
MLIKLFSKMLKFIKKNSKTKIFKRKILKIQKYLENIVFSIKKHAFGINMLFEK